MDVPYFFSFTEGACLPIFVKDLLQEVFKYEIYHSDSILSCVRSFTSQSASNGR